MQPKGQQNTGFGGRWATSCRGGGLVSRPWLTHVQTALLLAYMTLSPNYAQAQGTPGWFGGGQVGLLRQDAAADARTHGLSVLGRIGRDMGAQTDWFGEIGWLSTTRNTDIVFDPCDPSEGCFGGGGAFLGPTALLTVGVNLRLTTPPETVQGYLTAGPALFWAAKREPGSRAVGAAWGAGGGLIIHASAQTAIVADVSYRRVATTGRMPRWLVPITLGVEVR